MTIASRLVLLTIVYTLFIEVIFLTLGAAAFRRQSLQERIEDGALAARAILTNPTPQIDLEQSTALLEDAKILDLVIIREDRRERLLIPTQQFKVEERINTDTMTLVNLVSQSLNCIKDQNDRIILLSGSIDNELQMVETLVSSKSVCMDQWGGVKRAIPYMIAFSLLLGGLVYITSRLLFIGPIRFFAKTAKRFDAAKKNQKLVEKRSNIKEFRQVETAFRNMQIRSIKSFRQQERLATIGESVAKIQHDLRNMLSTAQMVADNLEDSQDPKVKRSVPRLVRAINRAVDLSTQTLEYGRVGEIELDIHEISLAPLIYEIIETEKLLTNSDLIKFSTECPENLTCQADPKPLKRILENLVRNARQIMEADGGGTITVRAEPGEKCTIWIEDTGPGFSEQARNFIFQPFKGSTRIGGSGLGLAICKELCELMDGTLTLDKSDETGTRFKIQI